MKDGPIDPAREEALRLMAPIISHEIRNPLAVIGNSSYFVKTKLSKEGDVEPKVLKHLGIIESELKHANDVIGEILAYARMRDAAPARHALNSLLQPAVQAFTKPECVKLEEAYSREDLQVMADPELAGLALRHLVRNAFEASAGKEITVRVSTRADGKWGVAEVSDTGPGIPAEAKAKLFTPFNTTKPRGIGLGLAYARKSSDRQKGIVEHAEGSPGAVLRIKLPLAG